MRTSRIVIAALVLSCGLAVAGDTQLKLVRGNPIQEFVSPVILEGPADLWTDDAWSSSEFRAFKCEGVVIDRLVITREFNKKRTEADVTNDVAVANNASAGTRSAVVRVQFVNDDTKLKLRKGSDYTETQVFSFTMNSGATRSEQQKFKVSAADLQDVFKGANPRVVISLNVTQS
jgi:hypothetical protein